VERWGVYSNEWTDGIYTAMGGRDGIYTAMSGEMGYIQQ
jgi:hypothetical protein